MNTNKDISGQLKTYIDTTDNLTVSNILEMLEVKETSLWFRNDITITETEGIDSMPNDEKELTYEQIKKMYPDWFNE